MSAGTVVAIVAIWASAACATFVSPPIGIIAFGCAVFGTGMVLNIQ